MMKANPFLILNTILTFASSGWYYCNDAVKMGTLFLFYALASCVLLWMGNQ